MSLGPEDELIFKENILSIDIPDTNVLQLFVSPVVRPYVLSVSLFLFPTILICSESSSMVEYIVVEGL